jgi:hypothetical protein
MTKGVTYAATPIEQFAQGRLRLGLELGPPVSKGLERVEAE